MTKGKAATTKKRTDTRVRTRRAILNLLKIDGPTDSAQLAQQLDVSAMAVRQHLYDLQTQGLVSYYEEARPIGRPAKLWQLTSSADQHFPESYAELSVDLIGSITRTFGQEGLDKLLAVRSHEQIERYQNALANDATLKQKLKHLARLRTDEGYMADVKTEADGTLLLVENHCPICAAARACQGLCQREREVFEAALGGNKAVAVERTEHIIAGARRCAYRVSAR